MYVQNIEQNVTYCCEMLYIFPAACIIFILKADLIIKSKF